MAGQDLVKGSPMVSKCFTNSLALTLPSRGMLMYQSAWIYFPGH